MNPRVPSSGDRDDEARRQRKQLYEARRAELTLGFQNLAQRISAILFRLDPLGLAFGANSDEYDAQARVILTRLLECRSENDLIVALHELFCRDFGPEKAGTSLRYRPVAREIWAVWRQLEGPAESR